MRGVLSALAVALSVLVVGQPALAVSLRALTGAAIAGQTGATVLFAACSAVVLAALGQALFQSYLIRIEILDRLGLGLTEELLTESGRRPTIDHLQQPRALDRLRVALDGWAIVSAWTGCAQLIAVCLGLVLTMPVLGGSWATAFVLIPFVLPLVVAAWRAFRTTSRASEHAARTERVAENALRLIFDSRAAAELRIAGAVPALLDEYARLAATARRVRVRGALVAGIWLGSGWLIFSAGLVVMLVLALSEGMGAPGSAIPIIAIALQLQGIAVAVVSGTSEVVRGRHVGRARAQALTAPAADSASATGTPDARLVHGIDLCGVRYSYPGAERLALDDLTVTLPAGALVAVVGSHGSGKSTLVSLLTGMHVPGAGRILVDGRPLSEIDPAAWRGRVTACLQDFVRLPVSARDIVSVGDLNASGDDRRVDAALDFAGARNFVATLPEGYDTMLGHEGAELSGGQWQRLALARSRMLPDPLLVVLDEFTASIDPLSERELFERVAEEAHRLGRLHGTITLAVTHRYATVHSADLVLVLDGGRLVEAGTHHELLALGGRYATLYGRQRDAYLDPATTKEHL